MGEPGQLNLGQTAERWFCSVAEAQAAAVRAARGAPCGTALTLEGCLDSWAEGIRDIRSPTAIRDASATVTSDQLRRLLLVEGDFPIACYHAESTSPICEGMASSEPIVNTYGIGQELLLDCKVIEFGL